MKLGLIDIEKAYLGTRALDSSNAFLGIVPLISSGPGPTPGEFKGLRLKSTGATTIEFNKYNSISVDLQYSLDNGTTWAQVDVWGTINLNDGDEICFKGNNPNGFSKTNSQYRTIKINQGSGTVAASGNIMSLVDNGACTTTTIPNIYCFAWLFNGSSRLTSITDLTIQVLTQACYLGMFQNCSNLNYIRCLATDISASNCLNNWVSGVASTGTFVKNPEMNDWPSGTSGIPTNWTILDDGYQGLKFKSTGSTTVALTNYGNNAPDVKYSLDDGDTWTLWDYSSISLNDGDEICFKGNNSTGFSLTYTLYSTFNISGSGTLAASGNIMSLIDDGACTTTTLPGALRNLFENCAKLTSAPNLPATTFSGDYTYFRMFYGCSNLATAPAILPSTTLANSCYSSMFRNCTSLTTAPELPALSLNWGSQDFAYLNMFNGCTSLNYIKCLATTKSGNNCTTDWVNNVASNGTFIKASNASWTTGADGIPSGWTVQDA